MSKTIQFAFRLVHIANIPHILRYGFVHPTSPNADKNYVQIGDSSVINVRNNMSNYKLCDYIPFYFGPRSPMLYVIQHGYNGVTRYEASELVYCIIRIDDIINHSIECVFTDGHALNKITSFYNKTKLIELNNLIKYNDVYTPNWIDLDDVDLKRRKEAELLIKDELPPQFIRGFVVYNEEAAKKFASYGVSNDKLVIKPNYYF